MAKLFCESCGSATDYTISLPSFCSKCGKKFGSSFSSAPPKPSITIQSRDTSDDEPVEVPQLDDLQVDIKIEKDEGIKFGQEYRRGKTGYSRSDENIKRPYKKPSKKNKNVQSFLAQQISKKSASTEDIKE